MFFSLRLIIDRSHELVQFLRKFTQYIAELEFRSARKNFIGREKMNEDVRGDGDDSGHVSIFTRVSGVLFAFFIFAFPESRPTVLYT
jgi:hypothetical protein